MLCEKVSEGLSCRSLKTVGKQQVWIVYFTIVYLVMVHCKSHMGEMRNVYKILVRKPERKRLLRTTRKR
jgi:hypothetical protein